MGVIDRLRGKNGVQVPAEQIPLDDPMMRALTIEQARLRGQDELVRTLMKIIQTQYHLPDGASVNTTTGKVTLPE